MHSLAVCGAGTFNNETGLGPCQLCPRNTYTNSSSTAGGRMPGNRQCTKCPEGTFTVGLGTDSPTRCLRPCSPGQFSNAGLEPCSVRQSFNYKYLKCRVFVQPCPFNFYQPNVGQQSCLQCLNTSSTIAVFYV